MNEWGRPGIKQPDASHMLKYFMFSLPNTTYTKEATSLFLYCSMYIMCMSTLEVDIWRCMLFCAGRSKTITGFATSRLDSKIKTLLSHRTQLVGGLHKTSSSGTPPHLPDDCWRHILSYLTDPRDVLNLASVNWWEWSTLEVSCLSPNKRGSYQLQSCENIPYGFELI